MSPLASLLLLYACGIGIVVIAFSIFLLIKRMSAKQTGWRSRRFELAGIIALLAFFVPLGFGIDLALFPNQGEGYAVGARVVIVTSEPSASPTATPAATEPPAEPTETALPQSTPVSAPILEPTPEPAPTSPIYRDLHEQFHELWASTDQAVTEGKADRNLIWGTDAITLPLSETYTGAPGDVRTVQYFDKARMEMTDPEKDPEQSWNITTGLLVVELVSGSMQVGVDDYEQRDPAEIPIFGDRDAANQEDAGSDETTTPTYATIASLLDEDPLRPNEIISQRLSGDGHVVEEEVLELRQVTVAVVDNRSDHSIATPFWDFMWSSGTIWEDGEYKEGPLFRDPFFATGRPIIEPYWTTATIDGIERDVLIQCFERRCLVYRPNNTAEWRVESGNVGRHYYEWRYGVTID